GMTGNVLLYNMNMDAVIVMSNRQLLFKLVVLLAFVSVVTCVGMKKLLNLWLKFIFSV
ncbi:hypothetical protein P692DRAFT_20716140, partial [Suillus brevipes Sb2]